MTIKTLETIHKLLATYAFKKEVEYAEVIREVAKAEAASETGGASEEIYERLGNARKEKSEALEALREFEDHEFS
jgi:hypothetical protein